MSNKNFFDFIIKFSSEGIELHFSALSPAPLSNTWTRMEGTLRFGAFSHAASGDEVVLSGKRPYFPEKAASGNGSSGKVLSFPEKIKTEEMDGRYSTEKSEPGAERCHGGG